MTLPLLSYPTGISKCRESLPRSPRDEARGALDCHAAMWFSKEAEERGDSTGFLFKFFTQIHLIPEKI
jgi:hypothetical protein